MPNEMGDAELNVKCVEHFKCCIAQLATFGTLYVVATLYKQHYNTVTRKGARVQLVLWYSYPQLDIYVAKLSVV